MNVFSIFAGSFHSAATYRAVRQSGGFFMGYALLIVAVCTLAVTVYYGNVLHRELFSPRDGKPALFDDVVTQIANQVPVMTWANGTLTSSEPAATVIKISGTAFGESFTDEAFIAIDTSGKSTHENMETPILITAKELITKTDKKTEIKSLPELMEKGPATMLINRAMAQDLALKLIDVIHENLTKIYVIVGGIMWFFIAITFYIMRIFMLLALGLVGMLIGNILNTPIKYASAVGLAAVSFTPIALLDTILFAGFHYPTRTIVIFAAGVVALFAAIKCSQPTSAPTQGL